MNANTETINQIADDQSLELSHVNKSSREFKVAALELLLDSGLSRNKVSQLLGFSHSLWDYWIETDKWFAEELERVKAKYGDSIRFRLAQFAKRDDKLGMVTNFFIGKAYCDEFADKRIKIDGKISHSIEFKGASDEPESTSIDKAKVIDVLVEPGESVSTPQLTLEVSELKKHNV